MKFDNKTFQQKYEAWKNGADYWKDIRGINLGGDSQVKEPTPEERQQMDMKVQAILNAYDAGKDTGIADDITKPMPYDTPLSEEHPILHKYQRGKNYAQDFYDEMVAGGVDPMVAAGIAGNVQQESSFIHNATSKTGKYKGYAQLSPELRSYVEQAYGGYGHAQQMQFLIDMAKGKPRYSKNKYYKEMRSRAKSFVGESYISPESAASGWESYFEKSGGQNIKNRTKYARSIYDRYYKPDSRKTAVDVLNENMNASPIIANSPSLKQPATIRADVPTTLLGPSAEEIKAQQYKDLQQKTFDYITQPTPLPPAMQKMLQGNNKGKDGFGQKFWQRRGKNLHFDEGKDPYLYPPTDYDFVQARDLGDEPGEDGHWPSRNYKTGRYLKSPVHPTLYKGIIADNSLGYYPYYQDGAIYTNTWRGNEPYTGIVENYIQHRSKKKGVKK